MKYCMDASALIDLGERHYPIHLNVFKPIWDYLFNGIDNETIISVDYVKIELEKKASEWRTSFIPRAEKMFLINSAIEAEYSSVIFDIENNEKFNINAHRERFLKGADPWLVALARNIGNCTVISGEKKKLSDYGLGAVCKELGVAHLSLVEFFERNNI